MNTETALFAPADVTAETKVRDIIETVICSRCGGSGRMPFSVMAGVCFKCGGRGTCDTKRGAAARAFYRQLVRTPTEGLRPGDKVLSEGFTAGTMSVPSRWVTVLSIRDNAAAAAEAGTYEAALSECGSCAVLKEPEAVENAAEQGATLYPQGERGVACFRDTTVVCEAKNGERHSLGGSRGFLAKLEPEVARAIYRTVAEYQQALTKVGKPRKGSRWA